MEGSNPFECPLCMEFYDDVHIPTTFSCGHSCCMSHLSVLRNCFICRQILSSSSSYHPTYALRDGSMLFKKMQETPIEESDEEFARRLQQQWLEEDNTNLVSQKVDSPAVPLQGILPDTLSAPSHLSPSLPPPPPPPPPRAICRMTPGPTSSFSPSSQSGSTLTSPSYFTPNPTSSTLASHSNRKMSFLNIFSPSSQINLSSVRYSSSAPAPPARSPGAGSGAPMVKKSCGHFCSFSSLTKCCGCMDLRPVIEEGTYPVYQDGTGWVNSGRRNSGYCPVCKN